MRVLTTDPFRTLDRVMTPVRTTAPTVPLDVVRHEDRVELFFDLPGFDADRIELTVDKRELVLRAERSFSVPEGATAVRAERRHGAVTRRLLLAENLDTDRLQASYRDGVLAVAIPVVAEAQPRRVAIAGLTTAIEGELADSDDGEPAETEDVDNHADHGTSTHGG